MLTAEVLECRWKDIVATIADEAAAGTAAKTICITDDDASHWPGDGQTEDATVPQRRKRLEDCVKDSVEYWDVLASETLRTYVTLVPEDNDKDAMLQALRNTTTVTLRGVEGKHCVLILCDTDLSQESTQRPHLRKPLFNPTRFKKLLATILQARGCQRQPEGQLPPLLEGDVVAFHDDTGGKAQTQLDMLGVFQGLRRKNLMIAFSETSLRTRKQKIRGDTPYSQLSTQFFYSTKQLIPDVVPERPRVKYDGFNVGDCVGWVHAKSWTTSWQLQVEKINSTANSSSPQPHRGTKMSLLPRVSARPVANSRMWSRPFSTLCRRSISLIFS